MKHSETFNRIETLMNERYSDRFKKNGICYKTLGWGSTHDQDVRFKTMIDNIDFQDKTVMDIGCGFADFYKSLSELGIKVNYIGVDINDDFTTVNRQLYPEASFVTANILTEPNLLPSADIVVANGVLNLKLEMDNLEYTKIFIENAFKKTKELLCVDFISDYRITSYPKEEFIYYHKPSEVLDIAVQLSNSFRLIHNYAAIPQKEFMLVLEK